MRLVLVAIAVIGGLLTSSAATAQTPTPTPTPAPVPGQKVWITLGDATVHHGIVSRVTPELVTLDVDGATMTVASQNVRRIEVVDGVSDGIWKGAVGLGAVGAVMTGYLGYATCESAYCLGSTLKIGLAGAVMGGAAGALVGGLLDVANPGREVIFERTSVAIVPGMSPGSRSVSVLIRW